MGRGRQSLKSEQARVNHRKTRRAQELVAIGCEREGNGRK